MSPIQSAMINFLSLYRVTNGIIDTGPQGKMTVGSGRDSSIVHAYDNVRIVDFRTDKAHGIAFEVEFRQLKLPRRAREEEWNNKRLLKFGLVALVLPRESEYVDDGNPFIIFAVVADHDSGSLADSEHTAQIRLQVIEQQFVSSIIKALLVRKLTDVNYSELSFAGQYLVEFPGVFLEAYRPVLQTLQSTKKLPFQKYLAPRQLPEEEEVEVEPPKYARKEEFGWDLERVMDNHEWLNYYPRDEESYRFCQQELRKHSTMDEGQVDSFLDCLKREIALVQGPPGTGKSYLGLQIMKVMLSPSHKTILTPIVCICATNHALDQFLEHCMDIDANIVRIGSRTQSKRVAERHISLVVKSVTSKVIQDELTKQYVARGKLEKQVETIRHRLISLRALTWDLLEDYLQATAPGQYFSFLHTRTVIDVQGYANNLTEKPERDVIRRWFRMQDANEWQVPEFTETRQIDELVDCADVWFMTRPERVRLHDYWRTMIITHDSARLGELSAELITINHKIEELRHESSKRALRHMDVIGLTTSGAARNSDLLRALSPKVIVCEEAGECLEGHILASLTPSAEHLILIGDPDQLRPSIANYSLSIDSSSGKSYRLDESLLERLSKAQMGRLPLSQLHVQRRMRSCIADCVRNTLYPKLIDHESTVLYPPVRGAAKDIFFFHHEQPEGFGDDNQQSKKNQFEAEFCSALTEHFLKNGYSSIAVLTPYLGQMKLLHRLLGSKFSVALDDRDIEELNLVYGSNILSTEEQMANNEGLMIRKTLEDQIMLRTVDNFQGEEADIVIISLVRNFTYDGKGTIGFLNSTNRTNVLLSRARHGMYLLGNSDLLAQKSGMWETVINTLRENDCVGPTFPLSCAKHGIRDEIDSPEAILQASPDGGCTKPCDFRLSCGHVCSFKCHIDDPKHEYVECRAPCVKTHSRCGHACTNICSQPCGLCDVVLEESLDLPCGHVLTNPRCYQKLDFDLYRCQVLIKVEMPDCHHQVEVPCWRSHLPGDCSAKCGKARDCGHACSSRCVDCHSINRIKKPEEESRHLGNCTQKCDKHLFCGHKCILPCHQGDRCPPCQQNCLFSCVHSTCSKPCLESCAPCAEWCENKCEHQGRCTLPCGAPCTKLPCDKRCSKIMVCGHECPIVCGELHCAGKEYCGKCAKNKAVVVDIIEGRTLAEVNPDKDPFVLLECGHAFTISTLDGVMDLRSYYSTDETTGSWLAPKEMPAKLLSGFFKCPLCRSPILNVRRYRRPLGKLFLDVTFKKSIVNHRHLVHSLKSQSGRAVDNLIGLRSSFLRRLGSDKSAKLELSERQQKRKALTSILKNLGVADAEVEHWAKHSRELEMLLDDFDRIYKQGLSPITKQIWDMSMSMSAHRSSRLAEDEGMAIGNEAEGGGKDPVRKSKSSKQKGKRTMMKLEDFEKKEPTSAIPLEIQLSIPMPDYASVIDAIVGKVEILTLEFREIFAHIFPAIPTSDIRRMRQWWAAADALLDECLHLMENYLKHAEASKRVKDGAKGYFIKAELVYRKLAFRAEHGFKTFEEVSSDWPDGNKGRATVAIRARSEAEDFMRRSMALWSGSTSANGQKWHSNLQVLLDACVEKIKNPALFWDVLTESERLTIIRALRADIGPHGTWFQCRNGHSYTVGECGAAMQVSRCPECDEHVGGADHFLVEGNEKSYLNGFE